MRECQDCGALNDTQDHLCRECMFVAAHGMTIAEFNTYYGDDDFAYDDMNEDYVPPTYGSDA